MHSLPTKLKAWWKAFNLLSFMSWGLAPSYLFRQRMVKASGAGGCGFALLEIPEPDEEDGAQESSDVIKLAVAGRPNVGKSTH